MIFYKFFRVAFYISNILAICSLMVTNNIQAYEQVYTDVIKNISLANKIIQSLIKNYEYYQNTHNSEESSSSSNEINGPHKMVSSYKKIKKINRSYNKTQKTYATTLRPGTVIIYETESSKQQMTDTAEKDESATEKQIDIVKNSEEDLHIKKIEKEYSEEYKESDDIEAITINKPSETDISVYTSKPNKNITNMDIHTKNRENEVNHNGHGKKTRFSVLRLVSKNSNQNKLKTPLKSGDTRRRIKKVVHSEIFSPNNIWSEIVHKPIKLRRDQVPYLKTNRRPNIRSYSNEIIAIVVLDKNTKESVVDESKSNRNAKRTTRSQLEHILRETYGEICLQVPLKKCNKALKAVNKNVCKSRFKCKSDFKSEFIDNGKIGCKKEFSFTKANNTKKNKDDEETIQPLLLRMQKKNKLTKHQRSIAIDDISKTLQIPTLRDKYEKQCQKASREKCNDACIYALEETCASHNCVSRKKKAFKKACKEECKNIFRVNKDSSDDSDDDDNDSDSDSGNDSESDSGSD